MAELGYMDDPGNRMGWLDGQSLRAARVVIDIGVHCGFEAPDEVGGGAWAYDKAWTFLTRHANKDESVAAVRARPLPRLARAGAVATRSASGSGCSCATRSSEREGEAFDLKAFHRAALDVGGVGLDTLRAVLDGSDTGMDPLRPRRHARPRLGVAGPPRDAARGRHRARRSSSATSTRTS